jgi:hypothetical protein
VRGFRNLLKKLGVLLIEPSEYGPSLQFSTTRNALGCCYKAGRRLLGKAHSKIPGINTEHAIVRLSSRFLLQSLFKFLKVNPAAEVAVNTVKLPVSYLRPYQPKERIKYISKTKQQLTITHKKAMNVPIRKYRLHLRLASLELQPGAP